MKHNDSLGERLKVARKNKGLTQEEAARVIGVKAQTISGYENNYRQPDAEVLKRFADTYEVTVDYLLARTEIPNTATIKVPYGSGKTFSTLLTTLHKQALNEITKMAPKLELADILDNDEIEITEGGEPLSNKKRKRLIEAIRDSEPNKKEFTVPVLGTIRAGIPLLSEQNIIGEVDIPADLERIVDFALIVRGDSMIGAGISENDIVLCKENNFPNNGQIVVALVNDDETTLKFYINQNGEPHLKAANPNYEDIVLKPGDQIQGHVVRVFKEPPSIHLYEEFFYLREEHFYYWNKVIDKAIGYGIKPNQLEAMIDMQWEMLRKMVNNDE